MKQVSELAASLVSQHHAADPERFFMPAQVEEGYTSWLGRELERPQAVVLVAELEGRLVGYAYGTLEGRDWNALLDEHGAIHDILIHPSARGGGLGRRLLDAIVAALEAAGAQRIVLLTMVGNHTAQRLFARAGFRPTLLEMTRNRREATGESR